MQDPGETEALEATEEQLAVLRELGVAPSELDDLDYAEASERIAALQAMRENAERTGRP